MRSSASSSPAALVATISASTGSCSSRRRARALDELAERDAADAQAILGDRLGCGLARDHDRLLAGALERAASRPPTPPGPSTAIFIRGRRDPRARVDQHARVDEHAGVHHAARVDGRLGAGEGERERVRALAVIPRPMIAPDGVVVGDRAALGDDRVRDGALDCAPLLDLLAASRRARSP